MGLCFSEALTELTFAPPYQTAIEQFIVEIDFLKKLTLKSSKNLLWHYTGWEETGVVKIWEKICKIFICPF